MASCPAILIGISMLLAKVIGTVVSTRKEKSMEEIYCLADPYKSIMIEREVNQKPLKDIAKTLGMNLSTVKTRISKARKDMADNLQRKHPSLVKAYYERHEEV